MSDGSTFCFLEDSYYMVSATGTVRSHPGGTYILSKQGLLGTTLARLDPGADANGSVGSHCDGKDEY